MNTVSKNRNAGIYRRFGKRCFDLLAAAFALVVLSPVLLAFAVLVRIKLGSPILFRQKRPGLEGEPFILLKFRTMTDARNSVGELLPDEVRLTSFGKFLRSSSIDELPELWNVIRGDMSLVGPRPLLMQYLPLYSTEQARRHEVLPGVTGWAQVSGRNALEWEEKFACDTYYVEHVSFLLDLDILLRTVSAVVFRRGISQEGSATMPVFKGSSAAKERTDR